MSLNCMGTLKCKFFSINIFFLMILNDILLFLTYFIVIIQYTIIHKICVNWLLILLVSFPVNSKLLIVNFGGMKIYVDFWLGGGSASLILLVQESTVINVRIASLKLVFNWLNKSQIKLKKTPTNFWDAQNIESSHYLAHNLCRVWAVIYSRERSMIQDNYILLRLWKPERR